MAYLAKRFVIYLSTLHKESGSKLEMLIQQNGGYILHIDGTSEGASPHLISAIDEISNFVLAMYKFKVKVMSILYHFLKK